MANNLPEFINRSRLRRPAYFVEEWAARRVLRAMGSVCNAATMQEIRRKLGEMGEATNWELSRRYFLASLSNYQVVCAGIGDVAVVEAKTIAELAGIQASLGQDQDMGVLLIGKVGAETMKVAYSVWLDQLPRIRLPFSAFAHASAEKAVITQSLGALLGTVSGDE